MSTSKKSMSFKTYSEYKNLEKAEKKAYKKEHPELYEQTLALRGKEKTFRDIYAALNNGFKKEYKALFSVLTDEEQEQFRKFRQISDIQLRQQRDVEGLKDVTLKMRVPKKDDESSDIPELDKKSYSKIDKSIFTDKASKQSQVAYSKDVAEILNTVPQDEIDAQIDEYFADMDKVIETRPVERHNHYVAKKFPKPKWDVDVDNYGEYVENDYEVEIRFGSEKSKKKGNPYGLYKSDNFSTVKSELIRDRDARVGLGETVPEVTNKDVDAKLKQQWNAASEDVKAKYQEAANEKSTYFDAQISKNAFENLMTHMQKTPAEPVTTTIYSKTEVVEEPVITKAGIPLVKDGKTITKKYFDVVRISENHIEKKRSITSQTSSTWGFRIDVSSETELPASQMEKYDINTPEWFVRQRTRWSWDVDGVRVELTKVVNPKDRRNVIYEAEVEILKPRKEFSTQVQELVFEYTRIMQKSLLSQTQIAVLRENYNSIFTEFVKEETVFEFPAENDASMGAYKHHDTVIEAQMIKKPINPELFINYENKPQSFDYKNIFNGYEYRVTPKLDGVRVRLFYDVNGVFEVDHRSGFVTQIGEPSEDFVGTIIDCEDYKGEYYPFDVLAFKGVNFVGEYFDARLASIKDMKGFNTTKPFFTEGNAFAAAQKCFEWMDKQKLQFDGLIFQRNDEEYYKFNYKTKTMKWKPLEEITVDLLTRVTDDKVELFSGGDKDFILEYSGTLKEFGIPVEYETVGDFIAEYNFVEGGVKFKGVRKDKIEPNFHSVVKSNHSTFFYDKVSKDDLVGDTIQTWRKWASAWKRNLIAGLVPSGASILDVGVGRGGGALFDMAKKASKIYGIDPSNANLAELRDRLSKTDMFTDEEKSKIVIANLKGQDTDAIENLLDSKVDVITLFFSISFFYESGEDFESLMDTINQCAKKNAIVIVQLMDGDRIFEETEGKKKTVEISKKNSHGKKMYKIIVQKKKYATEFGTKVSIAFPLEKDAIIGESQDEFLASETTLTDRMAKNGFVKLQDDYMDKDAILQDSNLSFARLNRVIVYSRGKGVIEKHTNFTNYVEEYEEDFINPLSQDDTEDFHDFKRVGVIPGKDSFLASVLYGISKKYRDNKGERSALITKMRANIHSLIDENTFALLQDGNVKHNITYDLLHTKVYDTIKDGKQVSIVHDVESASKAAFNQYLDTIDNGYVGHEIANVIGILWEKRIVVYSIDGKVMHTGNPESSSVVKILKIDDISYEPLV